MSGATLKVQCPCCDHVLTVDVQTGQVLAHGKASPRLGLDEFMAQESRKSEKLDQLFDQAKSAQADKAKILDEKFRRSRAKGDSLPDVLPKQWD